MKIQKFKTKKIKFKTIFFLVGGGGGGGGRVGEGGGGQGGCKQRIEVLGKIHKKKIGGGGSGWM